MSDDAKPEETPATRNVGNSNEQHGHRTGSSPVGITGTISLTVYLVGLSILLIYTLIALWPVQTGDAATTPASNLFGWELSISDDARMFLIVALAGGLGGQVHALRSFYWYIGNRELVLSWVLMYLMLPFVGGTLGLLFYFVIRGGFFSPQSTIQETSPFGFVAMAGLVGLFSEQAVLKLKAVADTLFSKPKPGANAKPQEKE